MLRCYPEFSLQEMYMLKLLIISLCLMAGLAAMSGCHADAETHNGHGVSVGAG